MRKPVPGDYLCLDCGVNTSAVDGTGDYYMVHDEVWALTGIGFKLFDGILCRPCLSERIGRPLTLDDYNDYPVNDWIFMGDDRYIRYRNHYTEPKPYNLDN